MKVVVLGANGFLGQCIIKYLKKYDLIPLTRDQLELQDFSLVKDWLIKNKPDVIVNCAIEGGTKSGYQLHVIDHIKNNVAIFLNFYNNAKYFSKFISIGSGAEFDIRTNIENVYEQSILTVIPNDSYGYSKNVISRLVLEKSNFYTLRLFGCFDNSEPEYRLFKKFVSAENFSFHDRQFDYISVIDFCKILEYYISNNYLIKDINCVYQNKLWLSEILSKFNKPYNILGINPLNYTGNGDNLKSLNIGIEGLDSGIEYYKG